ncbi:23S rRNA (uracil(1939)-C(5))-methyltransferase RlmD [Cytophagaceae bacterium DM2B3-1]|uniref:23S rRNA (Uracil(1939)-C(5))-methyltransferase RlmD n=1 Tax=Xanthocytophaga flava TaxID=3048013 RepID=A0ABT7CDS0_9BACT|nr:23S rRNA (uracil(1939)-C(5))-methyltransferase RlmD [Xanthocytophaga flavus]MDJ1472696.1 23S rRNA (uracil(1939)-C(5))-methyltransferase RlmD [Xanthocytophaga flavus]MDJ1491876.1 23S rRNA (uracil(1939)-C(5))-methyltransferase RlmD [Xanthocytophaga flavus]
MRKKNKSYPILEKITVSDFAAEGKCLARYGEIVVFIEGIVAPGDVVDLRVFKQKKNFWEAQVIKIHEASSQRTTPFCQHFGVCGGCKWQHIPYTTQLAQKQDQVTDNLERIGKIHLPEIQPILPSKATTYYRNKLEYTFSSNRWLTDEDMQKGEITDRTALGFHIPKRFDKILDIETCYLQPDPSNKIRLAVREFARQNNYPFFDLVKQEGFLRNLIIRTTTTGELMVIVQVFSKDEPKLYALLDFLRDTFPAITSLQYVINAKGNETFHDLEVVTYHGKPYITEKMEDLEFRVGPKSFYQTNAEQALELYTIARTYADLKGDELVYDLYTGTGTIANFVARQAKKVVGLEYVPMAIEDAKINSEVNGISNTAFFAGDMKDLLTEDFLQANGYPDVVITDPPRAGMDAKVVEMLLKVAPQRIVYVSCNPATQARDLALLDEKYVVMAVQPVDMFPHTYHVENVAWLEKRPVSN